MNARNSLSDKIQLTRAAGGQFGRTGSALLLAFLLAPLAAQARPKYIGADVPSVSGGCGCKGTAPSNGTTNTFNNSISNTEGNLSEQYPVVTVKSNSGPGLDLALTYNSFNTDGSKAQDNLGLGYGWTHSYNVFLFGQFDSNLYRMDGMGRVTKYQSTGSGTYASTAGYFETLTTNSDGSITLKQKDGTTYLFKRDLTPHFFVYGSVQYHLASVTDRNNNVTTITYDSNDNLSKITDTYGRSITFTYNANKEVSSITDPLGRVTAFTYDSTHVRLASITDPAGKVTTYSYNSMSELTQKVDKDGRTFSYSYNSSLKPIAITDGAGGTVFSLSNPSQWATDSTALNTQRLRVYVPSTTSKTDGRGNVWTYNYDANGRVVKIVAPDGAATLYNYDPATLNVASKTDANGNTTSYTFDSQGNLLTQTDALGFVTAYSYEPVFNQMTSMTDPNGRVTTYAYDAQGNKTQMTDAAGAVEKWTYDSQGNVLSHTDENNHTTTYVYDSFGNCIKAIDPLGDIATMTYDAVGNLTSRTDANGHTTTYVYDGLNRLVKQTDPLGLVSTYTYDGQGNRASATDRNGNATQYQYDQRSRLIKITDALGQSSATTYDGNDNAVTAADKNGHVTTYAYDIQNRLFLTTDAMGNSAMTAYDPVGNRLKETDANGHVLKYTYDALNRMATSTDPLGGVLTLNYDSGGSCGCGAPDKGSGIPSSRTDSNGKVTYFKYDALYRLTQEIHKNGSTSDTITPNDAVTIYGYDAEGNRISITEPNSNATTFAYDALNRKVSETNAAGDTTTTAYDPVGNIASTISPTADVITYSHDADDRTVAASDGRGTLSTYTYDPEGHQLTQTDGNGNTTATAFDAIYRVVSTTDPLGASTSYLYDPVGNPLSVTDRDGNVTAYHYDADNRRTSVTDALGNSTQDQYDAVGNLIAVTDANSHTTAFLYDGDNRRIKDTFADGTSRSYSYDAVGNVLSRIDENGATTNYTYNDLYFLLKRTYPVSPADNMTYDLSGRLISAERGGWVVTVAYDGADRVTQSVQNGKTIAYTFNVPSRIDTVTYPSGRNLTKSLDIRSRLTRIDDTSSSTPIVQYTYDAGNRVLSRNYRNGTSAAFSYDPDDRTTNLQHSFGASPIAGFAYAYDNEGNKKYEQKLQDTTHSEAYQYDGLYRMIDYQVGTLVGSSIPAPTTQTQYALDPLGNWTTKTKDGIPENRTHNAMNEIAAIDATSLAYDNNGNLTGDGTYTYAYDEENRLVSVTRLSDSAVIGQYQYDALSRRVQKIANPAGVPLTTRYFYDSDNIAEEQDGGGVTQATYVYGNYVDEILTMDRAGQTYYYHQNALWSVEAVTDSTANPVERYSYDIYGLPAVTDGGGVAIAPNAWGTAHSAIGNPYLFVGRQNDEETGVYSYRARYYDPVKGRFLQRDPAGYEDSMNLYEYVRSRPTALVDPYGLTAEEMQAVYEKLAALCDKKDCLDRCTCTVEKCKAEAAILAKAYVNRFHAVKKPYVADRGDIHAGWMCYQWAGLIQRELGKLKLDCWKVNWVGIVDAADDLVHNYVFVSLGDPKGAKGPIRDCGKILDPWKNKAPDVFDDTWAWHKWNYIHDPATDKGQRFTGGKWKDETYPPPWAPAEPNHTGAKYPDGKAYTPPDPVNDWKPK